MRTFVRGILFVLGVSSVLGAIFLFWVQYRPNKYKFGDFETIIKSENVVPSHLSYKDIALPIKTAQIENGKWPLTDDSVVYLGDSGPIGGNGNVVMYGHNWRNLLGFLKNVKTGEEIRVTTSDNHHYNYIIDLIQEVTPDQTHILAQSEDSRLTIYTCSGIFDRKRLVVVAKRQE